MAKILILNLPLHGHVNPTIALTKELVDRGHDVTYLINKEFGDILAPTGATILTYEAKTSKKLVMSELFTIMSTIYFKVLEIGKDYDCLIYEMAFLLGAKVGKELNIKTVCLTSTFALSRNLRSSSTKNIGFLISLTKSKIFRKLMTSLLLKDKRLRGTDLIYELVDHNPDLNIIYTSREFQIHNEYFDEKQFIFVGPSVNGRSEESDIPFDEMKGKIIYISLGTISTDSLAFYKTCIEAFKDTDASVIMSIGKQISREDLGVIPDNFYIYPFVPQVAVLKHTDLFITHCGMNSANEAIYYGVPVLGIPQRADQPLVANRMKELGLGEVINKKQVTADKLKHTTEQILKNFSYRENMDKMRQAMLQAGGYLRAADAIENYIKDYDLSLEPVLLNEM